jgi:restriction system protein
MSSGGTLQIPPYDALMLPVLRHCAEKTWLMRDLVTQIADDLGLDQDERDQRIPSGQATIITSRVHWAKTFLKQAGLAGC